MSGKKISVSEHTLYDASYILKEAGIEANPKAVYTFTNTSSHMGGGSLQFVVKGTRQYGKTVSVKGSELHHFAVRASEALEGVYKDTPLVVKENLNSSSKEYQFTVSSERPTLKGNKAPVVTVNNKLVVGDNKATDVIKYKDPENHAVSEVSLYISSSGEWDNKTSSFPSKVDNIGLVFDGAKLGNSGSFSFTVQQLNWLKFHAPMSPLSDKVSVGVQDIYGAKYSGSLALTVGK